MWDDDLEKSLLWLREKGVLKVDFEHDLAWWSGSPEEWSDEMWLEVMRHSSRVGPWLVAVGLLGR